MKQTIYFRLLFALASFFFGYSYGIAQVTNIPVPAGYTFSQQVTHCDGTVYYLLNDGNNNQLFTLAGTTLNPIENPTGDFDSFAYFTEDRCTGECYTAFYNDNFGVQLYSFDGNTFAPIPNPSGDFNIFFSILNDDCFDSCLFLFANENYQLQLYTLNGSTYTLLSAATDYNYFSTYRDECTDICYYRYYNTNDFTYQIYTLSGTTLTQIVPDDGYDFFQSIQDENCNGTCLYSFRDENYNTRLYTLDGTTLSPIIPNDGFDFYVQVEQNECTDECYFIFRDENYNNQLYVYDGTTLTNIPYPNDGYDIYNSIDYDECSNTCFFVFRDDFFTLQLYTLDGTSFTQVLNPYGNAGGYNSIETDLCGGCYYLFRDPDFHLELATYDNTTGTFTAIPSPPGFENFSTANEGECGICFIEYRKDDTDDTQLYTFDGNALQAIPNATDGFDDFRRVINDRCGNCYLVYRNDSNQEQIYTLNNNTLSAIQYPADFNTYTTQMYDECTDMCYFVFRDDNFNSQNYELNAGTLTPILNPTDGFDNYWNIITDECTNNCYYLFRNDDGNFQLYILTGTTYTAILNPTDGFNNFNNIQKDDCNETCLYRFRNSNGDFQLYTFDGTNYQLFTDDEGNAINSISSECIYQTPGGFAFAGCLPSSLNPQTATLCANAANGTDYDNLDLTSYQTAIGIPDPLPGTPNQATVAWYEGNGTAGTDITATANDQDGVMDGDVFTVEYTDENECINTTTVTTTVNPLTTLNDETATLCANAANGTDYDNLDLTSYQTAIGIPDPLPGTPNQAAVAWYEGNGTVGTDITATANDQDGVMDGDVFTVEYTDENGCINTATVTITVNPAPAAPTTNTTDFTICEGDAIPDFEAVLAAACGANPITQLSGNWGGLLCEPGGELVRAVQGIEVDVTGSYSLGLSGIGAILSLIVTDVAADAANCNSGIAPTSGSSYDLTAGTCYYLKVVAQIAGVPNGTDFEIDISGPGNATDCGTSIGVSSLTWHDAPTGGTQVGTGTTFNPNGQTGEENTTVNTNTPGTYTFYAEAVCDGCSSNTRTEFTLKIEEVPLAPTATNVTICAGIAIPNLQAESDVDCPLFWYNTATGGTALAGPAPSFNPDGEMSEEGTTVNTNNTGTYTFYVENNCIFLGANCNSERTAVTLEIVAAPEVTPIADMSVCESDAPIALNPPTVECNPIDPSSSAPSSSGGLMTPNDSTSPISYDIVNYGIQLKNIDNTADNPLKGYQFTLEASPYGENFDILLDGNYSTITAKAGQQVFIPSKSNTASSSILIMQTGYDYGAFTAKLQAVYQQKESTTHELTAVKYGNDLNPIQEKALIGTWSATCSTCITDNGNGTGSFDPTGLDGTYTITYTDNSPCTFTCSIAETFNITVNTLPTLTPQTPTLCANSVVSEYNNLDLTSYQTDIGIPDPLPGTPNQATVAWYEGNGTAGTDITATANDQDGVMDGDVFTVEYTDENGCASTATVTLTIEPAEPVCMVQDISIDLDAAGNATITAADIDNGSTTGCVTPPILNLGITDFTCDDIGENIVNMSVSNGLGASETCNATVTVNDPLSACCTPATIETQPVSIPVCVGETAEFSVSVMSGTLTPNYQWQADCGAGFADITGATSATLTLANVSDTDACDYRAIISNDDFCETLTSEAATLTVNSVEVSLECPTILGKCTDPVFDCMASPPGGIFTGTLVDTFGASVISSEGIIDLSNIPDSAIAGQYDFTYTYTDPATGCSDLTSCTFTLVAVPNSANAGRFNRN